MPRPVADPEGELPDAAAPGTPARSIKARLGLLAKAFISLGILGYLASTVEWAELAERFRRIDAVIFLFAVAALAFPILLTSLRWQIILRSQAIVLPVRRVIAFDLVALFFNSFLPGSTGGDAVRVIYAIRQKPDEKTRIVLSIVFDRGIGLAVLLVFALLVLWAGSSQVAALDWVQRAAIVGAWIVGIAALGLASLLWLPLLDRASFVHALKLRWGKLTIVRRGYVFLREIGSRPGVIAGTILISALSYLFNFLSGYLVALSLGIDLTYPATIMVLAVVYTVTALPIAISGHGVRELLMVALFEMLLVGEPASKEAAIAFSVMLFAVQLLWSVVGGIVFLGYRQSRAAG